MNVFNTNSKQQLGRFFLTGKNVAMLVVWCLFLSMATFAQTKELARHYVSASITLKSDDSKVKNYPVSLESKVYQEGATWLRLFFEDVNLGKEGTVTITSKLDGASQTLTSSTIKEWSNTSAYFNGNEVTIELRIPAGEKQLGLKINRIGVGDPDPMVKSQCGSADDRIDATDDAIGRIVPVGCTGWIISNGRLVTAGHCLGSSTQVVEFNVPKSNPDRSIVHPGPEDQYPILSYESPYRNNPSRATDWGVFIAGANTQTGLTPIEGQGTSYTVVQDPPSGTIRITGFGTDTGIDNQTQQTHTGPLASFDNTFVSYRTDTTGGNSGSPIIDEATGFAVGVHAYGGCSRSGGSNSGERTTIPEFWIAMGYGTPPPPPVEVCEGDSPSFPYAESFEGSLGVWTQSSLDDINWDINSGGTASDGTGPSAAIDGSSYIYVEASGNGENYPNKRAALNSPCLDFGGLDTPTISFDYHMYGSAVNTLRVEARIDNEGDWNPVFEETGDQGDIWNSASVDLSAYAGEASVQLRLLVITGNGSSGWQSDIAVDTLAITNGTVTPPPPSDNCTDTVDSFPYAESFEGTTGDWSQSSADDVDWDVNSGGTPSNNTGPAAASDGNSYIYVEASGDGTGFPNKTAVLNSPCFDFSNLANAILTFDYHMYGSTINSLSLEAKGDTSNWEAVFSENGNQGNSWNEATVDLSSYEGESGVQLRFTVITGTGSSGWQSDIAIDNVQVIDGDDLPPPPVCESLDFTAFQINGFANQDSDGDFSVSTSGATLSLTNNTWKYIDMDYTVTSNTVIEFDFSSTNQGEIHGVGFENDNDLTRDRYFKVHGTQNYGVTNYDDYSGGTETYVIPVGDFYTGAMDRLVFINDDDNGSGNTSTFSNVKIYEGACGQLAGAENALATRTPQIPTIGTEDELNDSIAFSIAPNPTKGIFSIAIQYTDDSEIKATVYSILGNKVAEIINLKSGVNMVSTDELSLTRGIYLVTIQTGGQSSTQKLIVN